MPGGMLVWQACSEFAPWQQHPRGGRLMTAVTAPARRSLIGAGLAAFQARAKAQRRPSRIVAAVTRIREHLPTLASLASADFAAFLHGPTWGFGVLAACITLADFAMTGR